MKPEIKESTFSDGRAKSHRITLKNGRVMANGSMLPGTIEFGVAEGPEEFIFPKGKAKHGDTTYSKKTTKKDRLRFKKGDTVTIECLTPGVYWCYLGKKPKGKKRKK